MESSKLVSLLKQFDARDWKEFQRFIESSYFNRRPKIIELYQIFKKSTPLWSKKKLTTTYISSKLFPDETVNEKRLIDLRNTMVKLIEKYWLVNKETEPAEEYRALAIAYHQNGFPNYRDYYFKKSEEQLKVARIDAEDYHSNLFNLSLVKHKIVEEQGKRNLEPNLQKLHDNLDVFFLCTKLKYYCKVLNYQNFRSHNYSIGLVDAVLKEAIKDKYATFPSIQIYYHGVLTLLNIDNEDNFYALKKLIQQHTQTFSIDEMQNIFVLARNFCVKNYNRGKRKYIEDTLDLYKIEIDENIIFQDGKISHSSCLNIIKLALFQNEAKWAIRFLEDYKEKMAEDIYHLSLAKIHFYNSKYTLVLEILLGINFKEVLLELAGRGLILKTYFQLCRTINNITYEDKLEAYIGSFNIFLKRKKEVLTRSYLSYLNLVSFVSRLNKLYWIPEFDSHKYDLIRQEILSTPETAEWDWLKEITSKPESEN